MKQLNVSDCKDKLSFIGRTFEKTKQDVIFFNWTCSGMEFEFTGKYLLAEFFVYSSVEFDGFTPNAPKRIIWPWIAVFLDDEEEPFRRIEINRERDTRLIFSSERAETHKIKILKISENAKGKTGIRSFLMDGDINPIRQDTRNKLYIEFIGDSITCGFGNETAERDRLFYSGEENGWMSHAAVAARKMSADYGIISVSGITAGHGIGKVKWPLVPMTELYPYTDRLLEESMDKVKSFTAWDFKIRTPDIIVINLGTNDSSLISMENDDKKGQENFKSNYYGFLEDIRKLNGPKPIIICALGPLDYYLYSDIEMTAAKFSSDRSDHNIRCFRYGKIKLEEGFGACGHPSMATQLRMGSELADFMKRMISEGMNN